MTPLPIKIAYFNSDCDVFAASRPEESLLYCVTMAAKLC